MRPRHPSHWTGNIVRLLVRSPLDRRAVGGALPSLRAESPAGVFGGSAYRFTSDRVLNGDYLGSEAEHGRRLLSADWPQRDGMSVLDSAHTRAWGTSKCQFHARRENGAVVVFIVVLKQS